VKIASQTIGVMSTPKAGGTDPRIRRNNGSVGHTARLKGTSLRFAVGYHEMTTRHNMAKEKMLRKGPSTFDNGCTQASVSEIDIDEEIVETVVDIELKSVFIIVSIMFNPLTAALSIEATGTGAKEEEHEIEVVTTKSLKSLLMTNSRVCILKLSKLFFLCR